MLNVLGLEQKFYYFYKRKLNKMKTMPQCKTVFDVIMLRTKVQHFLNNNSYLLIVTERDHLGLRTQ